MTTTTLLWLGAVFAALLFLGLVQKVRRQRREIKRLREMFRLNPRDVRRLTSAEVWETATHPADRRYVRRNGH